jgi:hypothetical protein
MVDKGVVACGMFNNVQGHIRPMHDEEYVEEKYALVQVLEECSAKVFGINYLGFHIVGKLDSIALSLCSLLSVLKSLASSSFAMFVHTKSSAASLANAWPELGRRRGLRSTCLHAHAMAVNLTTMLNVHELTSFPTVIH